MRILATLFLVILTSCSGSNDSGSNGPNSNQSPTLEESNIEILIDRSDVIWGFDFLPDEKIIFSERSGRIFILDPATEDTEEVQGVPAVSSVGEAGLLDLKLHPNFEENRYVYFCYTVSGRSHALGRGVLNGNQLTNVQRLFESSDENNSSIHFGCRIAFQNDDLLFLSIGDQSEESQAQNLDSHLGKILRLHDDGSIPSDNPFLGTPDALPEIWSLGHRNPQGLVISADGTLYSTEHGPIGGDELNIIRPGANYGWPLVTRGRPAGPRGQSAEGFVDPIISWTPAIAPSGITIFDSSLIMATLRGRHVRKLELTNENVGSEELLLEDQGWRFRTVHVGPDGRLYFSTDDGRIGRF